MKLNQFEQLVLLALASILKAVATTKRGIAVGTLTQNVATAGEIHGDVKEQVRELESRKTEVM